MLVPLWAAALAYGYKVNMGSNRQIVAHYRHVLILAWMDRQFVNAYETETPDQNSTHFGF